MKTKAFISVLFYLLFYQTSNCNDFYYSGTDTVLLELKDSVYQYYNESTDICSIKELIKYNNRGKITEIMRGYLISYDPIDWVYERETYIYDYNENLSQILVEDSYYGDWYSYRKEDKVYVNNLLSESVESYNIAPVGEHWMFYLKEVYSYDFNGNHISTEGFVWNDIMSDWNKKYYKQYFYNDVNMQYQFRQSIWDENSRQYVYTAKTENNYNENNIQISTDKYSWNTSTREWSDSVFMEYQYNGSLMVATYTQRWEEDSTKWLNQWKYTYTYDARNNLVMDSTFFWNNYYSSWQYRNNFKYFYSFHSVIIDINSVDENNIVIGRVFPNPGNGTMFLSDTYIINYDQLKVYTTSGKLLRTLKTSNNIDLTFLTKGIYLVELSGKAGRKVEKVVIK